MGAKATGTEKYRVVCFRVERFIVGNEITMLSGLLPHSDLLTVPTGGARLFQFMP